MSKATAASKADESPSTTMTEDFQTALSLTQQGDAANAVPRLEQLQERIAQAALFSVRNETMDDVATSSIPFLSLEHELAKALTQLGTKKMDARLAGLRRACDLWVAFFQNLQQMELVSKDETAEYQALMELSGSCDDAMPPAPILSTSRDAKIARYNAKKQIQQDMAKFKAMLERRARLGLGEEEMDGHDKESLERSLNLKALEYAKQDAMEEWASVVREIPMLQRMVQHQSQSQRQTDRYGSEVQLDARAGPPRHSNRPLQVTRITQNPTNGQLIMKKEEIRAQVFRPGWNLPTMTLEELADKEVAAALEREESQKAAEAARKEGPRRYEFLVKDGLEDNAELVDASAKLDRDWDDFKDENPRGSGNKRGDVGDRNF